MISKRIMLEYILDDLNAQDITSRLECTHFLTVGVY